MPMAIRMCSTVCGYWARMFNFETVPAYIRSIQLISIHQNHPSFHSVLANLDHVNSSFKSLKFSLQLPDDEKGDDDANEEENVEGNDPGLVEEEEKDVGVVKYDVYRSYWRAAGVCLTFSIFLSLFFMQGE